MINSNLKIRALPKSITKTRGGHESKYLFLLIYSRWDFDIPIDRCIKLVCLNLLNLSPLRILFWRRTITRIHFIMGARFNQKWPFGLSGDALGLGNN
jgi:hypothetical protein